MSSCYIPFRCSSGEQKSRNAFRLTERGNAIRGTSYWRLLLGEPKLKIPKFHLWLFPNLQTTIRGPIHQTRETFNIRAQKLNTIMSYAPRTRRCSAYALAEVANLAVWSTLPGIANDLPGKPHPQETLATYEYTSVSSDGIIDTGHTYGVRFAFSRYWNALTSTPTKWSTFKHSSGSDGLVAISAWGTSRMWLQEDLHLLHFTPCDKGACDRSLYGKGCEAADPRHYKALESVWTGRSKPKECDATIYHLTGRHLLFLELAIDALTNVISAHTPPNSALAQIWGDAPHGTPLPHRDSMSTSNARLSHLLARCKSIVECWDSQTDAWAGCSTGAASSVADPNLISRHFGSWKSFVPNKVNGPYVGPLCEQHSCYHIKPAIPEKLKNLTDHTQPGGKCVMAQFLWSVFREPGEDSLRSIPKRLIYDINQKPEAERREWKEAVVVGCLEMVHRMALFCEQVRIIPDVAQSMRTPEWKTVYIV